MPEKPEGFATTEGWKVFYGSQGMTKEQLLTALAESQARVAELERQLQEAVHDMNEWKERYAHLRNHSILTEEYAELKRENERLREALTFAISRWRDQAQALPPMSIGRINSTALADKLEQALAQTPKPEEEK